MAGQGLVINYTQCGYSKPRRDEERPAIWELTPTGAPREPVMIQCVHVLCRICLASGLCGHEEESTLAFLAWDLGSDPTRLIPAVT